MKKLFGLLLTVLFGTALVTHAETKNVLNITGAPANTYHHNVAIMASRAVINTTDSYTIGLWFKLDEAALASRTNATAAIIGQGWDRDRSWVIRYKPATRQIDWWRRSGWTDPEDLSWHSYCTVPEDGAWHFLTAVYSKEDQVRRLYLDGVLQDEKVDTAVYNPSSYKLYIGYWDWSQYFRGSLSEVSIWKKAFTPDEVTSLMQARPTDFTSCIAYWPFDAGNDEKMGVDLMVNNPLVFLSPSIQVLGTTDDFPAYTVTDPTPAAALKVACPTDRVNVTINSEATYNKVLPQGTEVTITASCSVPGATFYGWCGNTNNATINGETISLPITQSTALTPLYLLGNWIYSSGTISDGFWKLNVSNSSGNLTLNSDAKLRADFANRSLPSLLDLSKPITDANGTPYQIVSIGPAVFMGNPYLETVYLPETLKTITNGNQNNGAFAGCSELRRVIPFLPKSVTGLGLAIFRNCTKLESPLHLHNVATIEKQTFEYCRSIPSITTYGNTTSFADSSITAMTSVKTFTMPNKPGFGNYNIIPGWNQYQCRCIIDPENSAWVSYMADSTSFTAWDKLSTTIQNEYFARFPDNPKPLGLSKRFPFQQWLCKESGVPTLIFIR